MTDTTAEGNNAGAPRTLSRWALASYGGPAMPLSMIGLPIATYLPAVYADSEGFALSFAFVSLMLMLSRFFDGLTDPIIGYVSDRMPTRFGRRKPWILLGTPIFVTGIVLLFVPPVEFTDITVLGLTFSSGYPWLLGTLVLTYIGSTIKDVPYSAWGAELSSNYHERTLITSWREGFSVTGSLVGAFTPVIVFFFGYDKPTDAVYFLSMFMAVLMPILILNLLFSVPEREQVEVRRERLPLTESFRYVWQNEPYRKLIIIFLFSTLGAAMTNSLSFFFVKHVLLAGELYGFYLAPYFVSQIVAIPLWFMLSRRIGKHRATMFAIGWYALWSCFIPVIAALPQELFAAFAFPVLLTFLPDASYQSVISYFDGIETGKLAFFIGVMCLKGSSIGALSALPLAMAADVIDADARMTGKRQGGAYMAIWSMTRKVAYGFGLLITGSLAVAIGFDSLADPFNTTNTQESLFYLACLYSVVPACFKFVAMPLLWNYSLTEERLAEIQADIAAQEADSSGGATASR